MTNNRQAFVALLRGINVSGQRKIPMAKLRSTCTSIGFDNVQTYIQSGNVVLTSSASVETLEARLEEAIERQFRFLVPVLARSASTWARYVEDNPFRDEAEKEAKWVLLALSKRSPKADAVSELQSRATLEERVLQTGDAVWIHYANGIGRSKLTPAVLDRHIGSAVTARNWRTVVSLDEMLRNTVSEQAELR